MFRGKGIVCKWCKLEVVLALICSLFPELQFVVGCGVVSIAFGIVFGLKGMTYFHLCQNASNSE